MITGFDASSWAKQRREMNSTSVFFFIILIFNNRTLTSEQSW